MARYYQQPKVTAPISTFVPYNIEFVQRQLDKSQDRYDKANISKSQAFSAMNEINTSTPEDLQRKNQLIKGLHQKYDDIDTRYNGNLAAASSEITDFIGNIRKDDFWKRNEFAVKQHALEQEQRIKLGANYLGFKDAKSAWDSKNNRLRSEDEIRSQSIEKGPWQKVALSSLSMLTPNSLNEKGKEIKGEYADQLKRTPGLPFYKFLANKGITLDRLEGILNNDDFVNSFLENAPSFEQANRIGTTDGRYKAGDPKAAAYKYLSGVMQPFVNRQNNTRYVQDAKRGVASTGTGVQEYEPPAASLGIGLVKDTEIGKELTEKLKAYQSSNILDEERNMTGLLEKTKIQNSELRASLEKEYAVNSKNGNPISNMVNSLKIALQENALKGNEMLTAALTKIQPDLDNLQKLVDESTFDGVDNDKKILELRKKIRDVVGAPHRMSIGNSDDVKEVINDLTNFDEKTLANRRNSYNQFKEDFGVLLKQSTKRGMSKAESYRAALNNLKTFSKNLSTVGGTTISYNPKFSGDLANRITSSLSLLFSTVEGEKLGKSTITNSSGETTHEAINGENFNSGNMSNNVFLDFLSGTISIPEKPDESTGKIEKTYHINVKDLEGKLPQVYKIFEVPMKIFDVALDPTNDGYVKDVNFDSDYEFIDPKTKKKRSMTSFSSEALPIVNGKLRKKVTLNFKDGNPITLVGTAAQLTSQLTKTFGSYQFEILARETKNTQ